ncbi:MAG TPA: hypothetical protein ENK57_15785 [Polyangiaceae bacterium]|nr:hypothetical protein [Polyangiaceae bacterium]
MDFLRGNAAYGLLALSIGACGGTAIIDPPDDDGTGGSGTGTGTGTATGTGTGTNTGTATGTGTGTGTGTATGTGTGTGSGTCGNGVPEGNEECDDGNQDNTDACLEGCIAAFCGDGFTWAGVETCDNGQTCGADGWAVDFGQPPAKTSWGIYLSAPPSQQNPSSVVFPTPVFGTDGNQTTPYPTNENENSATFSPVQVIPSTLSFQSWHVDEGSDVDNKAFSISVDGGNTYVTVMDCMTNGDGYPMCQLFQGPRGPDQWDTVAIPVPEDLVGQKGIIRIDYDTLDACCSFEQGWYLRNANFFTICP